MKKNIFMLMINLAFIGALVGCCDSSHDDSIQTLSEIGAEVYVYPGDSIEPLSEDTEIEINSTYSTSYKTITLLSGSLRLLRGNYQVN